MSHITLRDEKGKMVAKFTNRAGMAAIDGMKGRWTTHSIYNKPAFRLDEDMKFVFGEDPVKLEIFLWKGYKFVLEGE